MGCTQSELFQRATSEEIDEFYALYQIDPWGTTRDNYHSALLCCVLQAIHSKQGGKKPNIEDYMLVTKAGYKQKVQTPDEQAKLLKSIFNIKE